MSFGTHIFSGFLQFSIYRKKMHLLGVLFIHFCTLYLKRTVECRKETINSCMTFQGKGYVRLKSNLVTVAFNTLQYFVGIFQLCTVEK